MVGSFIEAQLFGRMENDEESDFDDSTAKVVTRKIIVLEKRIQTCARMLT